MSNFRQNNGDDYPEAARKNLDDAQALLAASRYDGAGYHAGYVVECALKTLLQADNAPGWGHNLGQLSHQVTRLAAGGSPHTARYLPKPPLAIAYELPPSGWKETMRYRAPGDLNQAQAQQWVNEAKRIYTQSIQEMWKDGVIFNEQHTDTTL